MKLSKKILMVILGWVIFCFCACAESEEIVIDEDGKAVWNEIEGAAGYYCAFLDMEDNIATECLADAPMCYVPWGYRLEVHVMSADGSHGPAVLVSDYYGDPESVFSEVEGDAPVDDLIDYVDPAYSVKWADLQSYEVIANIKWDTARMIDSETLYFESVMPDGEVMRFTGDKVTFEDGQLIFKPGGQLTALDALGRICAASVDMTDGESSDFFRFVSGYTFTDATSVDKSDALFTYAQDMGLTAGEWMYDNGFGYPISRLMDFQPNFFIAQADENNAGTIAVSGLTAYYDEKTFNTGIRAMSLWADMYGTYMAGDDYDASKECFDLENGVYDFYLLTRPDISDEIDPVEYDRQSIQYLSRCMIGLKPGAAFIGDLKDEQGNILDKDTGKVTVGSTVEVTMGQYTMDVQLPVVERFSGAQTLHELTPYNHATARGEVTALVIPVYWQDQPEHKTEALLDTLRTQLGRVMDNDGQVRDYAGDQSDEFSLSAYYDIASYGQHRITSYVTDWYAAPCNFVGDKDQQLVVDDQAFTEAIYAWLMETYPDMDWSRFDADADGFFDAVFIVNAGESVDDGYNMGTYEYAMFVSPGYTGEGAGTQACPAIKNFVSMNLFFGNGRTLIHEYAHGFGLVDYYDVRYSGIDAVGMFDMQSQNVGDWNAYSKYAVGWIQPEVVTGLEPGQSVEIVIGELADTGDAIVIPAADGIFDGPFGEYIIIDLMTDGGVNGRDAAEYGLESVCGVRISHVNAVMEKRVLMGGDGVEYPIGTIRQGNVYNPNGVYLLEVIQAGGVNTFTDLSQLRLPLNPNDLFKAGDVFAVENYPEFFNDGRMDDGSAFGYTVEIVSIDADDAGAGTAVICVTRQ